MLNYAVLLVQPGDARGRPVGSVADATVLKEGQTCPPHRTMMTEKELDDLRAVYSKAVADHIAANKLNAVRDREKARLKREITSFIESCYSDAQQRSLLMLYQEATAFGYNNRRQKIQAVIDWIKSAISHYHSLRTQVEEATTTQAASDIHLDTASLRASNPNVQLEEVVNQVS